MWQCARNDFSIGCSGNVLRKEDGRDDAKYSRCQCKKLNPGEEPVAAFKLNGDKAVAVYAYCDLHGLWQAEIVEAPVCDLKPLDLDAKENYIVCKCNQVSYFDILETLQNHNSIENVLDVFEDVKNTTKCSTGCGRCYEKVIAILLESLSAGK